MQYRTGNEIRELFLKFFEEKNHMIEPGASLVPVEDPSLLWINSGVSAIKKYFDGSISPECPRISNVQRSLRTNDIENVGLTARHQTMFEMLGNFSIGDYFKKEAIEYAWEFLSDPKWIGLDIDKLYVTIYPDDSDAYDIWHNHIGLSDDRIFKLDGNFWEIGAGPCGPNSEIFYDRGLAYDPDNVGIRLLADDLDNDRYIEVWNIVFSEFNAQEGLKRDEYKPLPQKNIDTGMGLERLVSVVQNTNTNFETDLFIPIIKEIELLASIKYIPATFKAYRIIADHMRAITFALADGAMFSNEGRGYVLKRLLRRAARFGMEIGINEIFLYKVVGFVIKDMNDFYPYLNEHEALITKIVKNEELRFNKTLAEGLKIFKEILKNIKTTQISGDQAFKLYDTYGFPIENILELSQEVGLDVDIDGFNKNMALQKERARAHTKDSSNMQQQSADYLAYQTKDEFIGYDTLTCEAIVKALFVDGKAVNEIDGPGEIIFDQSVFYAESGGQIGDSGLIITNDTTYEVNKVIKAPHLQHLHFVNDIKIKIGDCVKLEVNQFKRSLISRNHSATHLLHQALKDVIGDHVKQAGSYVTDEYLRFDFNHYEKVSNEQLSIIEQQVNQIIFEGLKVETKVMSLNEAKTLPAMALFGEKYQDEVRVVNMGDYSMELCGGCHVMQTNEIGLFKIEREESVGSGIRRIIALTSQSAYQVFQRQENMLKEIRNAFGINDQSKTLQRVASFISENKDLKNEIINLKEKLLNNANLDDNQIEFINKDINFKLIEVATSDINALKNLVDNIKNEDEKVVVVISCNEDKRPYVVGCSQYAMENGFTAKEIALYINQNFNGKGGGKLDMAQGATVDNIDFNILKKHLCEII